MKRPAALFGFSVLATVIAIALFGEVAAYVLFASSCLLCVAAAVTRNRQTGKGRHCRMRGGMPRVFIVRGAI